MFNIQFFKVVYNIETVFLIGVYFPYVSARCCRVVAWSYAKHPLVLCRMWGGVLLLCVP